MKTHIIFLLSSFYIWSKPNYWNQFRGPNGDGDAKSSNLPVKFSEKQHMTWKTPMPGKAWSSPVVMDNIVWFTNAEEGGHKMWAVQLDWKTGKELRRVLVFENKEPQFCHPCEYLNRLAHEIHSINRVGLLSHREQKRMYKPKEK